MDWDFDEEIGQAELEGRSLAIRLKARFSEEEYGELDGHSELIPISSRRGRRTYVLAKPYILEPEISLKVGLYPEPRKDGAIGEVIGIDWKGMREIEIGRAQAWHYGQDKTLLLWGCYLYEPYREKDPLKDRNLKLVWQSFEELLKERFLPRKIFTPSWEPIYEEALWQEFLRSQGYRDLPGRVSVKEN
jgi:hypothetical protein